jgi:hypothetical protein
MADSPKVINVTRFVGAENSPDGGAAVDQLIRLIYRSVDPESWQALGGAGRISKFFNLVNKQWYISVQNATAVSDAVDKLLPKLAEKAV